ncbi:Gfo/Idh/MocA family oxidoreductase [Cyclobacteriaceae bacterium]|jgi:predicted dehydrogenase|nr:Gfo/Idh/MocA family oxidoreductase [Cyclobacteriaceae bacterium]|tara:strand:+ start:379 stop:1335 length:957 start_codon:yes stop_codon:yes gene_type:complete
MKKVSWGILGTAQIAIKKVIPAMLKANFCSIDAIASRDLSQAQLIADQFQLKKAYGSYEAMLLDPTIEAIYIPLPNHLHVEWILKSLAAGKHVLCEKPMGLNLSEVKLMNEELRKYPDLRVMEAFMYKFHPQWEKVKSLIASDSIGTLVHVHIHFSYAQLDPNNIRNQKRMGGGSLLDVGCYGISAARWLFEEEPMKVSGLSEYDPKMKTDRLTSGILQFSKGSATFTCGTQMERFQVVHVFGSKGKIEIKHPFNCLDQEATLILQQGSAIDRISFEPVNTYTLQGDHFSKAIRTLEPSLISVSDSMNNMRVIQQLLD